MLGYPGETIQDIEATIEHLKQTQADTFLTTVAYPIKGTAYYEETESRITHTRPWVESTERDSRIQGRYSDHFYWFAQRRLTNEVLYHTLANRTRGSFIQKASALAKAKIAHVGLE